MIAIAQEKQHSAQLCAKDAMAGRDRALQKLEMLGRRISAVALDAGADSDAEKDGNERRNSLDTVDLN